MADETYPASPDIPASPISDDSAIVNGKEEQPPAQALTVSTTREIERPLAASETDVVAAAAFLRQEPLKAIARIERNLPSVVEQRLYLQVGAQFRLLPESFRRILRGMLGDVPLCAADFEERPVGPNVTYSRVSSIADRLATILEVLDKNSDIRSYGCRQVVIENAVKLEEIFGEATLGILEELLTSIDELAEILPLKKATRQSEARVFEAAQYTLISLVANDVFDPSVLSSGSVVECLRQHYSAPSQGLRRLYGGEDDPLSGLNRHAGDLPEGLLDTTWKTL